MSEQKLLDLGILHFLITANVEMVHLQNQITKLEHNLTDPLVARYISAVARKHCREVGAALKMVEFCLSKTDEDKAESGTPQLKIVDPK